MTFSANYTREQLLEAHERCEQLLNELDKNVAQAAKDYEMFMAEMREGAKALNKNATALPALTLDPQAFAFLEKHAAKPLASTLAPQTLAFLEPEQIKNTINEVETLITTASEQLLKANGSITTLLSPQK